jgi:hypothetical protein
VYRRLNIKGKTATAIKISREEEVNPMKKMFILSSLGQVHKLAHKLFDVVTIFTLPYQKNVNDVDVETSSIERNRNHYRL